MDGNLAPNAGADWYNEPEEQVASQRDELNRLGDPRAVLAEIHEWFNEQAEACDHVSNIREEASIEVEVLSLKRLKDLLRTKADEFREFADGKF